MPPFPRVFGDLRAQGFILLLAAQHNLGGLDAFSVHLLGQDLPRTFPRKTKELAEIAVQDTGGIGGWIEQEVGSGDDGCALVHADAPAVAFR